MLAERLGKAWRSHRGSTDIDPVMRFADEGLVLGAGTVLAPSGSDSREVQLDHLEPRLRALVAAAHLSRPTLAALIHLRKAADCWNAGQDALAAMHLALSQIDRLRYPEVDAHRLFLADGLLKSGIEADAIIGAIEAGDPAFQRLYDPNQPRVPPGNGRPSGQWTSDGGGSAASAPADAQANPGAIDAAALADDPACDEAKRDCYREALKDHDPDAHANDNWKQNDVLNCRMGEWACNALTIAVQNVPLLDRGGVIFPHGGVVISEKGKRNLYIRPPARGVIPPFRRTL